jgi:hypothetical protein
VIVLAVFGWLVSKHHTKLYAPRDYLSPEGFFRALTPAEQRERLRKDVEDAARALDKAVEGEPLVESASRPAQPSSQEIGSEVLLVEELVLRQLELELGVPIQRQVGVGADLGFDGLILSKEGPVVVEIKYVKRDLWRSIRRAILSMKRAEARLPPRTRFILAVATEGLSDQQLEEGFRRAKEIAAESDLSLEIRFFDFGDLRRKFGLGRNNPSAPEDK